MNSEAAARLQDHAPALRAITGRDPRRFTPTDLGQAQRLVDEHGHDLRYVPGIGWHAWDGQRFRPDIDGEVSRRAKRTAQDTLTAAAALGEESERGRWVKFALRCHDARRIEAAISLARTEVAIVTRADELDTDPFLLNVENGTLDLRTGELRPHRREDLLTKLAGARFEASARSSRWDAFLAHVTAGDVALAAYLQRAAGYTLTGSTGEEVLPFVHGPAASGKTTFVEALKATLGDYSTTADFASFLSRDHGVRNDLARLAGARMVAATEVAAGQRFDTATLKALTGGDTITARFLYREAFEFSPQFTLWLAGNDRPAIDAHDSAAWRRLHAVPFTHTIPLAERDSALKRAFTEDPEELAAILAWAVEGCARWRRGGLDAPPAVLAATSDYRAENDRLADWLTSCCELRPDATTAGGTPARQVRALGNRKRRRRAERPRLRHRPPSPRTHPQTNQARRDLDWDRARR